MPGMKRWLSVLVIVLVAAASASAQAPGFGANGVVGPTFQGGDAAQITQRIMSSTRYKLTPGDVYQLSITMETVVSYSLILQQNYDIDIPYMGTRNVKGLYFTDLYKLVTDGLKKLLPLSQFVSLAMQAPARFDVSVFGGVVTPGIVTVYPLSRVSDAIALCGGRKPGASYRNVNIIRGEQKISVDLWRYGRDAVSEENPFLEPGDKVYIPAAQVTVALSGEVKYPGAFELIPGETLQMLIAYEGGTLPDALTSSVEILHFKPDGNATQAVVDLTKDGAVALSDGDRVRIPSIVENKNMVFVSGAIFGAPVSTDKPIAIPLLPVSLNVPYSPGLSLLAVLEAVGGPTPYARAKESIIVRKSTGERVIVDAEGLWSTRDPNRDIQLQPGDSVTIPLITEVFVAGEVHVPGKVPYNPALVVSDYLIASGGINIDTGNPNGIYFVDKKGGRVKAELSSPVLPGSLIVVDRNAYTKTVVTLNNTTAITQAIVLVLTFLTTLIDFIRIWVQ
jgi:polysaccharide biosynthesis/export protein